MPESFETVTAHRCTGCGLYDIKPPDVPGNDNCGTFEEIQFIRVSDVVGALEGLAAGLEEKVARSYSLWNDESNDPQLRWNAYGRDIANGEAAADLKSLAATLMGEKQNDEVTTLSRPGSQESPKNNPGKALDTPGEADRD